MEALPNEILEMIIGFLGKDDLLSVRLLNTTWQVYAEDQLKTKHFSLETDEEILNLIKITSWRNSENTLPTPFIRFKVYPERYPVNILEKFASVYADMVRALIFGEKNWYDEHKLDSRSKNNMFELLMNTPNVEEAYFSDSLINDDYKLHLPKLRLIECVQMDTSFILPILNAAPNVQEVKLKFAYDQETLDKWQDCINIFQLASTKGIEVKLEINIRLYGIKLQNLIELAKVPFKVTELTLCVSIKDDYTMKNFTPIQDFIQKHSTELKYLNVECTTVSGVNDEEEDRLNLTLDLKNMEKLKKLELSGIDQSHDRTKRSFEVNLVLAPLLKKVKIKLGTKLNFGPLPLFKSLTIQSNIGVCEQLSSLQIEEVRLQKLHLILPNSDSVEMDKKLPVLIQQFNNFLLSQANSLREFKISATNLLETVAGMEKLQLPNMVNLKKLKLDFRYERSIMKNIQLQHSQFPQLEFLSLNISLYHNPCSNESLENVHTLVLDQRSILDFEKSGLQFPKLKKLHILNMNHDGHHTGTDLLPFIFKNMTHVEELYIAEGFTWKEFIGFSRVFRETANEANILKNSVPNLGDMNALQSLRLGKCDELCDLIAVPYLISRGKLSKLKYFEVSLCSKDKISILPFFKIIETNNIKLKIRLTNKPIGCIY